MDRESNDQHELWEVQQQIKQVVGKYTDEVRRTLELLQEVGEELRVPKIAQQIACIITLFDQIPEMFATTDVPFNRSVTSYE